MRRPLAYSGVMVVLLCLWTVMAHAITLHVTDDTFTQKEAPNAQSGGTAALSVDNRNLNREHITYGLFDLALLPPNAAIDKAVLRFFVQNVAQAGKIKISVVTGGPWTEQTLTWNNAQSLSAVPAVMASIFAADEGSYVTVDITPVVQNWVNGTPANLGLALRGDSPTLNITLNSKENANTSHPMELEVALMGGPAGPPGPTGPQGATGPQGPQGLQGATGPQGPAGTTGATGDTGPQGPQGVAGPPGPVGPTGPPGPAGRTFLGAWNNSTAYVVDDVVTADGETWIAVAANTNSQPTDSNPHWNKLAAKGADGAQGLQGAPGATGPVGAIGATGATGPQGPVGPQGLSKPTLSAPRTPPSA
jgi:hypothetical protein